MYHTKTKLSGITRLIINNFQVIPDKQLLVQPTTELAPRLTDTPVPHRSFVVDFSLPRIPPSSLCQAELTADVRCVPFKSKDEEDFSQVFGQMCCDGHNLHFQQRQEAESTFRGWKMATNGDVVMESWNAKLLYL